MGNGTERERERERERQHYLFFSIFKVGEGDRHVLIMEYLIMKYLHVHVYTSRNGISILAYLINYT